MGEKHEHEKNTESKKIELGKGLKTIADWQRYIATKLHHEDVWFGHGAESGWEEANLLLSEVTCLPFEALSEYGNCRLAKEERKHLAKMLERRLYDRVPAAYLVHKAWFAGLPFYVDERVLVPRSPIGELITKQFSPWLTQEPMRILDLCTGSGCIAIACAAAFPETYIDASDISEDALAVAQMNVAEYDLHEQVTLIQSDGFTDIPAQSYDLIVTNPPYVDAEDMDDLPQEYHHEPELGLAAGEDGLDLVKNILLDAPQYLSEQGMLICEVGNSEVHVAERWPELPLTWLAFENGGTGVFLAYRNDLVQFKDHIQSR
ncbi:MULTISPECIES: 50S ribosomal protein L3 N(5)-glutamine methyltransferase [Gammaproteobacteria]|uniref:50S ribosomal protein L3 N(5)-glutamine methyltransferase n=1 Tax=Gammaproteobacteria TaxID=1236 RepID=UPI000DCF7054|nr:MULTISPECIES: 50S ribosomal protein L3 N(5)-glutamine methyltransferase [Gammaproteobacteria]RTE87394.1 50S ribosomal protein L3 N(5)-glutamine methyltransferase [Aliidiomarina sp. B3213]TCZ92820.1 50S ribosomal protein L3 N(5)-glutamine methyltransferase [Lysobacter sp. N42]